MKKYEVKLAICTRCERVCGATTERTCPGCLRRMEPIKAALKADGETIVFYMEYEGPDQHEMNLL